MRWLAQVHYAQPAQEVTRLDCMNEFEHMSARVKRLEEAILEVVKQAPQAMQEVVRDRNSLALFPLGSYLLYPRLRWRKQHSEGHRSRDATG
jgi:hypothetical protein